MWCFHKAKLVIRVMHTQEEFNLWRTMGNWEIAKELSYDL